MIFMFLRSAAQVKEYKGQVASKELENRKIVYENVNSQYISEDASTETDWKTFIFLTVPITFRCKEQINFKHKTSPIPY